MIGSEAIEFLIEQISRLTQMDSKDIKSIKKRKWLRMSMEDLVSNPNRYYTREGLIQDTLVYQVSCTKYTFINEDIESQEFDFQLLTYNGYEIDLKIYGSNDQYTLNGIKISADRMNNNIYRYFK